MSRLLDGVPEQGLSALAGKLAARGLSCADCPAFAPLAPMGPRFGGLGLCCEGGETTAFLRQGAEPACFMLEWEVRGREDVRR